MTSFEFFYGLNLAYRLYSMTDSLSKTIHRESFSAVDGQKSADLTLQVLKGMRTDEAAKLFYDTVVKKAQSMSLSNREFYQEKGKDQTTELFISIFR